MAKQNDTPYLYWLYNIEGLGKKKIDTLLSICKTANGVYHLREDFIDELGFLTDKNKEALKEAKKNMNIQKNYEELQKKQITFLHFKSKAYPDKLKQIPDAPFGIFYSGRLPNPDLPSVAVIGARQCTEYGHYVAAQLGSALAKAGIQVISGMARGIDSIAQRAAMEAGGDTFGVLGCGVDICYPPESNKLYEYLKQKGGIISEYPPGTEPKAQFFPRRNRIISGLSDAIVVVEAREKSGTLITVDMALEQGREVYVVPGRITDPLSAGCNRLMKQGAGIVSDFTELINEVRELHERQWQPKQAQKKAPEESFCETIRENGQNQSSNNQLSPLRKEICRLLYLEGKSMQQIYTELCEKIQVDIATFSGELFELEKMKKIYQKEGYYYIR